MLNESNHPVDKSPGGDPTREPKPVGWSELPDNLRRVLSSLPMHEWGKVMVTVCPSELMIDATALVTTYARVWEKSRAAEDFRVDRLTGEEREKYRKEFEQALRVIAANTIRLGVRAKLYGELQWEKSLLTCYAQDVWQTTWTKAMTRSAQSGAPSGPPRQGSSSPKETKPAFPKPKVEGPRMAPPPRTPASAPAV